MKDIINEAKDFYRELVGAHSNLNNAGRIIFAPYITLLAIVTIMGEIAMIPFIKRKL
jgi:hypothetical protein